MKISVFFCISGKKSVRIEIGEGIEPKLFFDYTKAQS